MKPLESYSKAEIIDAIYVKQRYDFSIVPALEGILAKRRLEKAQAEWEAASMKSCESLKAFAAHGQELKRAHGGHFSFAYLSYEELQAYADIARKSDEAALEEKEAWEKLNKISDAIAK